MRDHKHDRQYVNKDGMLVTVWKGLTPQEARAISRRYSGNPAALVERRQQGRGRWSVTLREAVGVG